MFTSGDVLGALATPPVGRNRRISSNEQPNWNDGNNDMTRFAPGEEFEFPMLTGPGYINHIWFTSHAGHVNELNSLTMRIYWDDRPEPGVEVPVGLFFGCGDRPKIVESFPVQVSETGSLTCYWRMPFAKSCRIVIKNDNPDRGTGLYWHVDWVQLSEPLPKDTPYFHARYRQEYPAIMGRDYTIAEIEGRGKYVGTVMAVTNAQDGWFGEGDDFFYIDGEEIPSLQGTGSEDYFNDAWGFRPRTSMWFGQPWWTGWSAGDWGVCYRWHVLDPVAFEKSLTVTIEHKGNHAEAHDGFFVERPDFISTIAMWYQVDEPKKLMGYLPGWPERSVPWDKQNLTKSFKKLESTGNTKPELQAMGLFGSAPIIFWGNKEVGASLMVPFTVKEDGKYAVRLDAVKAPDYGVFDIEIDGKAVASSVNFIVESVTDDVQDYDLNLGTLELSAGDHMLGFKCVGSGNGKDCFIGFAYLNLLKLPPMGERKIKGENEWHFILLPIGSAIYLYRLSNDKLPQSLEELVELGLLNERFLKDQNMYPLKSWINEEDQSFVVESTSPERWTRSWQGFDARR